MAGRAKFREASFVKRISFKHIPMESYRRQDPFRGAWQADRFLTIPSPTRA